MSHLAPTSGTALNYRMDGTRGKPVLVLSNSLGTDFAMWEPQIAALRPHFCIVRYDTRGHGGSKPTPGPYSIELLGRDVVALLDHLKTDRASFCGLSLGGMIGMWLGANAPQRIDKLVLANTAPRMAPPDMWNQRIEKVNAGGINAISDAVLGRWFTPDFHASEPAKLAAMKAMMERQPPEGYVACCAAVRDMDQREDIARITAPTLVITGSHDQSTTPADGAFVAARIEGSQLVALPAAHLSNIEAAPAFNAALTSFLLGDPRP
jgi:3-oxoadipate enol-lactonase